MSVDLATQKKLSAAYPDVATRAIRLAVDVERVLGLKIRFTEVVRSFAYQDELYSHGRTTQGPPCQCKVKPCAKHPLGATVTNAKGGESLHHFGVAFDICFVGADPYLEQLRRRDPAEWDRIWRKVGELAQAHGLTWGYDWNGNGKVDSNDFDRPHFQITYGLSSREIRDTYKTHGMPGVWARLDQIRGVPAGGEWNSVRAKNQYLDPVTPA